MQKTGMGMSEIAFSSLLLIGASDYSSFAQMGQKDAISRIQSGLPNEVVKPSALDMSVFGARTEFLASQLSSSLQDTVDTILTNGMASGATYGTMHDQILTSFGINPNDPTAIGWRAERIARTESMWAVREGALQEFQAQGMTYVNLIIGDSACNDCINLAQDNPYTVEEAGNIGDELHPNCQCLWEPDQEEFAQ